MNQELLDKIALLKEEMREILDGAEVQERSLTEDEKYQFEYKELEIRELEAQIQTQQENNLQNKNTKKMNFRENIAKAMQAITNNRSTEDLQNVAGNVISLSKKQLIIFVPLSNHCLCRLFNLSKRNLQSMYQFF